MRLPRVRFTVRRMMVSVVVISVFAAVVRTWSLSATYNHRCETHYIGMLHADASGDRATAAYHAAMLAKYQHAARYPWLLVPPDPPEPEPE